MKSRTIIVTLLVCLLCIGAIIWYRDHICVKDRAQIERIVSSDDRFRSIHVKRSGNGLFLDGSVESDEDLKTFFQKVNEVKRGRVVSRITVQPKRQSN
jgi:prepilin-type processing-associated H-X9-DG protein